MKGRRLNKGRMAILATAAAAACLLVFFAFAQEQAENSAGSGSGVGAYIPNQLVVLAKTAQGNVDIKTLANELGAIIQAEIPQGKLFLFIFGDDVSANSALQKIKKDKKENFDVWRNWKFSIPDPVKKPRKTKPGTAESQQWLAPEHITTDPGYSAQWGLHRMKEPWSGNPLTTDKGIAILDTGVDYNHSDLAGKVVKCFDYIDWDYDPMDLNGHGTHCAGIAAAKSANATGIHGVSPNSKIYAYRVLDASGSGGYFGITQAIYDAADNTNVKVLSMSFGGYLYYGGSDYVSLENAVKYARNTKGKICCVAAGNEYNYDLYYYNYWYSTPYVPVPAWFPASFTVGATEYKDFRAYFSNYDVKYTINYEDYTISFVDIVAPGYDILSTLPFEQYYNYSGTSMATPAAAGACARVWGAYPGYTASQVESRLISTGKSVAATKGFPTAEKRIDLMKALGKSQTGFQGIVLDAESGFPLYNVTVKALVGASVKKTTTTNKAGVFTLTGLTGGTTYTFQMSKSGYITETLSGGKATTNYINDVDTSYNLVPTRTLTTADVYYRIIVSWASVQPGYEFWYYDGYTVFPFRWWMPAGLEANAYLHTPSGYNYYWNNTGSLGEDPYVQFMHDSWNDRPVECHVIRQPESGTYQYVVCAQDTYDGWGTIKYSKGGTAYPAYPIVRVFKGNTLIKTISSSSATRVGTGTLYWHVFNLNGSSGAVTVVNKITNTQPFVF
jgi:subtilisin family serine protease